MCVIVTCQVVNEVDTCFPPLIDYVSKRILAEGVNMVLDPGFLACCDCTDNCQVCGAACEQPLAWDMSHFQNRLLAGSRFSISIMS